MPISAGTRIGAYEIVAPLAAGGMGEVYRARGKWQVSTNGGVRPVWSRDGKELFFIGPERKMMAAEIKRGATFEVGVPRPFLNPSRVEEASVEPITVVVNWTAGLKK